MRGFRVIIAPENTTAGKQGHFSGYHEKQTGALYKECPCCKYQMFPALNLDFADSSLLPLGVWPQRYLNVLFCPFCGFYMKPYWIKYSAHGVDIVGGDCSSQKVIQKIEMPYSISTISFRELNDDERPSNPSVRRSYISRTREEGVYHQVRGEPIKGQNEQLTCPDCGTGMAFAGILDYDDLNVPLYESSHKPVALIIGDGDCINWYTCIRCLVVGLKWVH
jgi:hypothetical protein